MTIQLHDIDSDNWKQCIQLKVNENQKNFVAPNIYSLVEAKYEQSTTFFPKGIYSGATMVGFVMYDRYEGEYWIVRLMVDRIYQGKGFGKQGLLTAIKLIKGLPDCGSYIKTSYVPENKEAEKLYESIGFVKTGEVIDGELVARLLVK